MRLVSRVFALPLLALPLAACSANAPLGSMVSMPPTAADDCRNVCEQAGLQMASLVVVLNSIGCVCEPKRDNRAPAPASSGAPSTSSGGAAAAASGAIIIATIQRDQTLRSQQRH